MSGHKSLKTSSKPPLPPKKSATIDEDRMNTSRSDYTMLQMAHRPLEPTSWSAGFYTHMATQGTHSTAKLTTRSRSVEESPIGGIVGRFICPEDLKELLLWSNEQVLKLFLITK